MRSGLDVVSLAVHRAGNAPDAGRVEHGEIDVHLVIPGSCNSGDAFLDETAVLDRKVDPVHHLRTVAGVEQDRIGPAGSGQTVADLARHRDGCFVLGVRTRHSGHPLRIAVDEKPAAGDDVRVGGRCLPRDAAQPVAGASQQIRVDRIHSRIRASKGELSPAAFTME